MTIARWCHLPVLLSLALGTAVEAKSPGAYTPPVGSAERRAIFDATRRLGDNHTRVWVVRFLKVQDGWAWTSGDPQSPDGTQHYEPESALLHKLKGRWTVVDQPCGEEACNDTRELARIRKAHPVAPAAIFQGWTPR